MENRELNLSSQVCYLETNVQNTKSQEKENILNNDSKIVLYFLYDDQIYKKLVIYELNYNNSSPVKQKIIYEIKYKEDIGYNNIHLISKANFNNKIYLIFISDNNFYNIYAGIFDLELLKYFPIIIDNSPKLKEIIKKIPDKDYITIFEQNKIFFFGGLIEQKKIRNNNITQIHNEEESKRLSSRNEYILNKSCIYFDIEKLDFDIQKFPENSLISRYKLGGSCDNDVIYLLGGFTSLSENNEENNNICNNLQFTKFFDDKMYQFSIAKIDGENPKDMIDCDLFFNKNKFLISFSGFKYAKIWILNINTNIGVNINLKDKIKMEEFNKENMLLRLIKCDINEINKHMNLIIAKIIFDEKNKDIKFEIINRNVDINI